jgi:hypothetical protein
VNIFILLPSLFSLYLCSWVLQKIVGWDMDQNRNCFEAAFFIYVFPSHISLLTKKYVCSGFCVLVHPILQRKWVGGFLLNG